MFKKTLHARNLALLMLSFWITFDFAGIYTLSMRGAIIIGITLLLCQFFVSQVATKMVLNNTNAKNSNLKNAMLTAGLPVSMLNEDKVRKSYSGKKSIILLAAPVGLLALACTKIVFSIDPVWFALTFFAASGFIALYPIYMELSGSESKEVLN